jgi:hypothetical protein
LWDFQIAPLKIWHHPLVRGMEERFTGRGYMDSNVQKKRPGWFLSRAKFRSPDTSHRPSVHLRRKGTVNDVAAALMTFTATTNGDDWGFASESFEEFIV